MVKKILKKKSCNTQDNLGFSKVNGVIFISTQYRKFKQIDLDFTDQSLFKKDLKKIIRNVKDCVLKIKIKVLEKDFYKIDIDKINEYVKDAYYCKPIIPVIVKEKRKRINNLKCDSSFFDAVKIFVKYHNRDDYDIIMKEVKRIVKEVNIDAL